MAFHPMPEQKLHIENTIYRVTEHPSAQGMPYGQEGRRAVVYQLVAGDKKKYALKVFKPRFRVPRMVTVSKKLLPYASLPGLKACKRIVLTGSQHTNLLRSYPDLTYAVIMPWVEGTTWQEILLTEKNFPLDKSLRLASSFAKVLMSLEERGVAHCDLSGPNLIIQQENQIGLVDLEEMYGPGFLEPKEIPAGSPGYAHQFAPRGLWTEEADRFAGAVLLAEMLCWSDPHVRKAAWGESYFAPEDLQGENDRYRVLHTALKRIYGERMQALFIQTWHADKLQDCPTFAEWVVALPEAVSTTATIDSPSVSPTLEPTTSKDSQKFVLEGEKAESQGNIEQAISLYRKGIVWASPDLSRKLEERIDKLEKQRDESSVFKQEKPKQYCPICERIIPDGQAICPHCGGIRTEPEPENPEKTWWQKNIILVGLFGMMALIMVCVLGYNWFANLSTEPAIMVETVVVEREIVVEKEVEVTQKSSSAQSSSDTNQSTNTIAPTDRPDPTKTPKSSSCPGAPPTRLEVGDNATVCTKNDPVYLRTSPDGSADYTHKLIPGADLQIIGGPECDEWASWWYWKVRTESGYTGWMAEGGDEIDPYFLCP